MGRNVEYGFNCRRHAERREAPWLGQAYRLAPGWKVGGHRRGVRRPVGGHPRHAERCLCDEEWRGLQAVGRGTRGGRETCETLSVSASPCPRYAIALVFIGARFVMGVTGWEALGVEIVQA